MLAGYNVGEALGVMTQNFKGPIQDVSRRLRVYTVANQLDLVQGFQRLGDKYFPKVTLAIIASNSKVVSMGEALKEGLDFELEIGQMKSSYATNMFFAVLGFIGATIAVLAMHFWGYDALDSVNYFSMMPEEGDSQDMLMDAINAVTFTAYVAMGVGSIWLFMFVFIVLGRDVTPSTVEKWVLKIPLLRGTMLNHLNFVTCYQLHKLLSKGVDLIQALEYVGSEVRKGVLKDDIERVLSRLQVGDTEWQDSFHSFSDLDRALLKSANRQDEIAEVFKAQSDQFLSGFTGSIKALINIHKGLSMFYLFMVVVVLSVIMFLPMVGGFDMLSEM
jgi:hypothetical protein